MTGMRPWGFIARKSGVSRPPNCPPASICSCGSSSSPISHMTFWRLKELRRPQTFSIFALLRVSTWRRLAEVLRQLLRGLGQRPKTPRTDHEFSVGPGISDPDDIDLHGPGASFCRDFRHHADPDAGGDHLADRIETVQPRAKAQARAEL